MKQKNQRVLSAIDTSVQCITDHPLDPEVPRVTTLFAELSSIKTALRDGAAAQITSRSGFRGAVDNRGQLREDLLGDLRAINKIGRALNKVAFPTAREKFRMPTSTSYA